VKQENAIAAVQAEAPANPSRRDFMKKTGAAALATVAAPALLTKYARASERPIKIGQVTCKTGMLAAFAESEDFIISGVKKAVANGITIAGKNHPVEFIVKDSRSDPNRAAEVTSELIKSNKVDLVLSSHTSDTTVPVSDQCEINGVPCLTNDTPLDNWFFGRRGDPSKGFKWTYHFFWATEDLAAVFLGLWESLPTNKVIGALWFNDNDGMGSADPVRGFPPRMKARGFKLIDPGRLDIQTNDFTRVISMFKEGKAEIFTGVIPPPQFATFWSQSAQQGFRPKISTPAKPVLFPAGVNALGPRGWGLTTEVIWSPYHPFKSSLTGQSARQLCDQWEQVTGKQWTMPMGYVHALYEVAIDTLNRAKSASPEGIRDALRETKMSTIVGPVEFKDPKIPNISRTPLVGGQWVKGQKFQYDVVITFNDTYKSIPKQAALLPLT
jgi:branched-chain amino acid transport system substrate-binding protein